MRSWGSGRVPAFAEIFPSGIGYFDQLGFLDTRPVFELLLAIYGVGDFAEGSNQRRRLQL
jgi:hypothetical protein